MRFVPVGCGFAVGPNSAQSHPAGTDFGAEVSGETQLANFFRKEGIPVRSRESGLFVTTLKSESVLVAQISWEALA